METRKKKEIMDIVKKAKTAFISTVDANGFPCVRAMNSPRKVTEAFELWFSTNTSSKKVPELSKNNKMCVYFYDKKWMYHGVTLLGTAEICEDAESKKEIWQFGDAMYYKKGVTDPDYCVLKFKAEKIRYYHAFKHEEFEV